MNNVTNLFINKIRFAKLFSIIYNYLSQWMICNWCYLCFHSWWSVAGRPATHMMGGLGGEGECPGPEGGESGPTYWWLEMKVGPRQTPPPPRPSQYTLTLLVASPSPTTASPSYTHHQTHIHHPTDSRQSIFISISMDLSDPSYGTPHSFTSHPTKLCEASAKRLAF